MIELPWHLILPMLISFSILLFIFLKRKIIFKRGEINWIWMIITVFFTSYFLILFSVICVEITLKLNLQKFDLNNDGIFSGAEITSEMQAAMEKVTSDTARNFAFITGFIYSLIITAICIPLAFIFTRLLKILEKKKVKSVS